MSTALITGASAGIGRAFAQRLAEEGYDLVLVARNEQRLNELKAELYQLYGVDCEVLPADLTVPGERAQVEKRLREGSPIDVLVNNAGLGLKQRFVTGDLEAEQMMLDLLVTAPMRLTHAAAGGMVQRGRGRIINISSVAGWTTNGTYSAAKAWLTTFTEGLAQELHGTGVTATAVCPGFTRTEFHERAHMKMDGIPGPLWLSAAQVADSAWRDAKRGRLISVPGKQYQVLSTFAQYAPRPVVRKLGSRR